jgi:hypothetical protein
MAVGAQSWQNTWSCARVESSTSPWATGLPGRTPTEWNVVLSRLKTLQAIFYHVLPFATKIVPLWVVWEGRCCMYNWTEEKEMRMMHLQDGLVE